jgi:putative transcriptional regulator
VTSLRGQLLIASPSLLDPNFRRTVVLIAEHTEEGAMGVVLNRPSDTAVNEAAPQLGTLIGDEEPVYVGGPVSPAGIVVLAEFDDPGDAAMIVVDDVGFPSAEADFDALAVGVRRARAYAGHAGWGPGQLESELEEEAWIVEGPRREELFFEDAEALWAAVLARKGGRYALLGRMPPDPSMN